MLGVSRVSDEGRWKVAGRAGAGAGGRCSDLYNLEDNELKSLCAVVFPVHDASHTEKKRKKQILGYLSSEMSSFGTDDKVATWLPRLDCPRLLFLFFLFPSCTEF